MSLSDKVRFHQHSDYEEKTSFSSKFKLSSPKNAAAHHPGLCSDQLGMRQRVMRNTLWQPGASQGGTLRTSPCSQPAWLSPSLQATEPDPPTHGQQRGCRRAESHPAPPKPLDSRAPRGQADSADPGHGHRPCEPKHLPKLHPESQNRPRGYSDNTAGLSSDSSHSFSKDIIFTQTNWRLARRLVN